MFFSDYDIDGFEGQDHVFTQLQKDTRQWIDQNIYGISSGTNIQQEQQQQQQQQQQDIMKTKVTRSTTTPPGIDKDNPS